MKTFQVEGEFVKKSTVMKLIVSMLCVTMFTACGERDSKKRNTGIYQGAKVEQPAADASDTNSQESLDTATTEENEETQSTEEVEIVTNTGDTLDVEEDRTLTTGGQNKKEVDPRTVMPPAPGTEDEPAATDGNIPVEKTTSTTNSGDNSPTVQVPVERTTPTQNNTASNKATRKDPLSGLGFYADTPYNSQFAIPQATHTGYSAFGGDPSTATEEAYEYKYTDLVSDNVMYKLKNLLDADINTYSSENELFGPQSIELSQAINKVYSRVSIANQTINVNIKIGKKNNVFENNTLEFYGSLKEDGTARLSPTQNSSNYNYILDVVCLDKTTRNCQTQQLVLSYYYKKDDAHGAYKKGSLCKRAYMVNRLGHATFNINTNTKDGNLDYIAHYVTTEPYLSQVCSTAEYTNYNNSIICLADLTYNTVYKALYESCHSTGSNPDCKTKFTMPPMGRFAQKIYLHTFAVAQGKAQYVMSLKDSDNRYMSYDGELIDTTHATNANIGYSNVDGTQMTPSFLASNVQGEYSNESGLLLNGIDSQSVMQFKMKYGEIKRNSTDEERYSEVTTDIIQRFPDLNLGQFKTNFPAPAADEIDDIKQDRDDNKDDDYSLKDKLVAKVKAILKDDTLKVTALDYTCDELKAVVQENKTVHIYGKVWKFNSSKVVHSKESVCEYKRTMGYEYSAERSNWKTKDVNYCHVGYFCQQKSSK